MPNSIENTEKEEWYKLKCEEFKLMSEKRETDDLPRIKETNKGLQEAFEINCKTNIAIQKDLENMRNKCFVKSTNILIYS